MKRIILVVTVFICTITFGQIADPLPLPSEFNIVNPNNGSIPVFGSCGDSCYSSTNIPLNTTAFKVSHGSPSFGSNGIWMWSYASRSDIRGEGAFTDFNFVSGKKYCIEADVVLTRTGTTEPIDPLATFNFDATNGLPHSPVGSGGETLPNHSPKLNIFSGGYTTTYPLNAAFTIKKEFIATSNFSQLWIYPKNPSKPHPQLNMRITRLVIKEVIPCPCKIEAAIDFKSDQKCTRQFFGNITAGSGTRVTGYLWDFGDGVTSTKENPEHVFLNPGTYNVTLTVFGIGENGECCTRKFKTKVTITTDCPQKCKVDAEFKVERRGGFIWKSCDLINTSSSNAYTTILGYEWYIDGVLISKNKDILNYRGGGKVACLRVYGMTKNGLCCYDEYCLDL
jgi:hypothetical protein